MSAALLCCQPGPGCGWEWGYEAQSGKRVRGDQNIQTFNINIPIITPNAIIIDCDNGIKHYFFKCLRNFEGLTFNKAWDFESYYIPFIDHRSNRGGVSFHLIINRHEKSTWYRFLISILIIATLVGVYKEGHGNVKKTISRPRENQRKQAGSWLHLLLLCSVRAWTTFLNWRQTN